MVGLQLSDEEEWGEAAAGDARLLVDAVVGARTVEEDQAEDVVHLQLGLWPILRRASHTPQRPVRHATCIDTGSGSDEERGGGRRVATGGGVGGHRQDYGRGGGRRR